MNTPIKAIVTGHSRGLGEALVLDLLHRQIPVLGMARGRSAALGNRFPQLFQQVSMSLGDTDALAAWLATPALRDFADGAAEILLINNAGSVQPVGALQDQDGLAVASAIALNVTAPLMLSAGLVQATPGKRRRILHMSSGAGRSVYPGWSVYCASKAALDHHARAVALDAQAGMRICSLAPGVIDTAMQAEIRALPDARCPRRQRFIDMHRNGELAAPADSAQRVIDYLLADAFGTRPVDDLRTQSW